ncbi:hypothetical protein NNRS527_01989 [Nitrosospira sp. NRS527]|nr:hypothetical protein NNRS527_01989 [Nitrosospira sp. NRS527]
MCTAFQKLTLSAYFLPQFIILAILNQVWNYHSVTELIPDGQIKRESMLPFYKMTDGRTSLLRNYIISTSMAGSGLVRS